MEKECLLTIVIPVMNREEVVLRTLESVSSQTLRPLRVVIVDNGSDDRSGAIIRRWADHYRADNFDVRVVDEPVRGACRARNRGLQEVTTDYVMFFDSDDVMEDNHLQRIDDYLRRRPDTDLLHWALALRDDDGWTTVKDSRSSDILAEQLMHSALGTARYCVRTSLLRDAGGWNEAMTMWNDYELGVRLLTKSDAMTVRHLVGSPTAIHCESADSLTGPSFSSRAESQTAALDAISQLIDQLDDERYGLLLSARRAVLAGDYRREGSRELADVELSRALEGSKGRERAKLKLIYAVQRICGRGASSLALHLFGSNTKAD